MAEIGRPGVLVVLVDLQAVIGPGGAWEIPGVEPVIDAAARLAEAAPGRVVASRHRPVPDQPGSLGPYASRADPTALGLDAAALVPQVAAVPGFDKHTFSAYRCPSIRSRVDDAEEVVVAGVETDCCVLATVLDLVEAGVPTTVVREAVLGPDEQAHAGALRTFERLGSLVRVRALDEVLTRADQGDPAR